MYLIRLQIITRSSTKWLEIPMNDCNVTLLLRPGFSRRCLCLNSAMKRLLDKNTWITRSSTKLYRISPVIRAVFKWLLKTNTKVITPANHNRSKKGDKPITFPRNYLWLAQRAGKIARASCHLFSFSLVKKWSATFEPITMGCNRNRAITFESHLKTALVAISVPLLQRKKRAWLTTL